MAIFQADIEKRLGSEFWSNRYIINAPDLANAVTFTNVSLVGLERSIHDASVTFTRFRVSSTAVNDGVYSITTLGTTGQRNAGSLLPLFNTLRLDLNAATGRPSRKFYRGVLSEADIQGDLIITEFGATATTFETLLDEMNTNRVVDPQGQTLTAVIVHPFVQMRQLRRSRRRRISGEGIFQ